MITEVTIKNYRSIVDATVPLAPFTLLIGANGTGKSNFIRCLSNVAHSNLNSVNSHLTINQHLNYPNMDSEVRFTLDIGETDNPVTCSTSYADTNKYTAQIYSSNIVRKIAYFDIDPRNIGLSEELAPKPTVSQSGTGAVQVLDSLFTGVNDENFYEIERLMISYISELEKLRFETEKKGTRRLVVSEKKIKKIPLKELSDGTKYLLTVLTILYQQNPPKLICLEDVDRHLHPRLYSQLIELLHAVVRDLDVQIIATTHNPYLLDQFHEREDAVIVVEKEDGESKFTQLSKRMEAFEELERMPLGEMWYLGVLGGIPKRANIKRETA